MLKKGFAILLIALIMLPTMAKILVIVDYELNMEQITKEYCINTDKPQLHCNGKCYLQKELSNLNQATQLPANADKLLNQIETQIS